MNNHYPPNSKPVVAFNSRGEEVYRFYSAARAGYSVNRDKRTISAVANGKRKTSAGFAWFFQSEVEKMSKEELTAAIKQRFINNNSTKDNFERAIRVSCLIDGKRVEFKSITACAKSIHRSPCNVAKIVRGEIKKNVFDIQRIED